MVSLKLGSRTNRCYLASTRDSRRCRARWNCSARRQASASTGTIRAPYSTRSARKPTRSRPRSRASDRPALRNPQAASSPVHFKDCARTGRGAQLSGEASAGGRHQGGPLHPTRDRIRCRCRATVTTAGNLIRQGRIAPMANPRLPQNKPSELRNKSSELRT